jgi:hypothetical protein
MEINRNYLSIADVVPFFNYYFSVFSPEFRHSSSHIARGKMNKKLKNAEEREGNENE